MQAQARSHTRARIHAEDNTVDSSGGGEIHGHRRRKQRKPVGRVRREHKTSTAPSDIDGVPSEHARNAANQRHNGGCYSQASTRRLGTRVVREEGKEVVVYLRAASGTSRRSLR